jgi:hypothetical protein
MIISHQYRYLFVQLPQTACTSIARELIENYAGEKILHKHSTYDEFLKIATPEEKTYFAFSCMRNPVDRAVSMYFKYKTDHKGEYSNLEQSAENLPLAIKREATRFKYIQDNNLDFTEYFKSVHKFPYVTWSILDHHKFDYIIYYEKLQQGFMEVLRQLDIEPKRELPVFNKTGEKDRDPFTCFPPELRDRAKWIFGPYMNKWGYKFPESWGDTSVSWSSQIAFQCSCAVKSFYWRYLHTHKGDPLPKFLIPKPSRESAWAVSGLSD